MSFINYFKVGENEVGEMELKSVTLAGISNEGIVLNAVKLNNEVSDAIQWFYNKAIERKYADAVITLDKAKNEGLSDEKLEEMQEMVDKYEEIMDELKACTTAVLSEYNFINRIALAILNDKSFRVSRESDLYKALRFSGNGENVQFADLSTTRKNIVGILNDIFETSACPYVKPVQVKLNLEETAKLVAIANNSRTRWTNKGIRTKVSKTIETETALQAILFVCKNCFKMVIPVKADKDDRTTI